MIKTDKCGKVFSILYLLIAGIGLYPVCGQNLVANPDFDQYNHCPPYLGQIHEATGWDSPNFATTDYFHSCSDSLNGNGVPGNRLGWQQPVSGQGYAGLRLWIPPGIATPDQREYLVSSLNRPLEADSFYRIRFHASLADFSTHTTDALGLGLSDTAFGQTRFHPFVPALRLPEGDYLTNRETWTLVSGLYRAKGGEQHLIIGNFLGDTDMTLVTFPPGTQEEVLAVYVFIDQISVASVPATQVDTTDLLEPEEVTCPGATTYQVHRYDTLICAGSGWNFQGERGAVKYLWEDGATDSLRLLTEPGLYHLTSFYPCDTVIAVISLDTVDCGCGVFRQNIFSPNGDGINDVFDPQLSLGASEVNFTVVDRWGRNIYSGRRSESVRWNGMGPDGPAPTGVYFWSLAYRCQAGSVLEPRREQGYVVIIR